MSYLSSGLKAFTGVGQSVGGEFLRTANAKLFPQSAPKVRVGQAVNDIIGLNAKTPGRYSKPPFPSSKGAPWASASGDPRAAVTGAARREELLMKRKAKRPVKGSITRSVKSPIEGPKSSEVSKVDDLFGMGDAPMGYKYGSRK